MDNLSDRSSSDSFLIEQAVQGLQSQLPEHFVDSHHTTLFNIFENALKTGKNVSAQCTGDLSTYAATISQEAQKFSVLGRYNLAKDTASLSKAAMDFYSYDISIDQHIASYQKTTNNEFNLKNFEHVGNDEALKDVISLVYPDDEEQRGKFALCIKNFFRGGALLLRYQIEDFFREIATLKSPKPENMSDLRDVIKWAIDNYFDAKFDSAESASSLAYASLICFAKEIREDLQPKVVTDKRIIFYPFSKSSEEVELKKLVKQIFPNDANGAKELETLLIKTFLRAVNHGLIQEKFTLQNFLQELATNRTYSSISGNSLIALNTLIDSLPKKLEDFSKARSKLFRQSEREWVKQFVRLKKIDESSPPCKERSEFLKRIALGYFTRISNIKFEETVSERPMSPLQGKQFGYFRDYDEHNIFIKKATQKIETVLNQKNLTSKDFFLTSDEAMKKSQKARFDYIDLDKIQGSKPISSLYDSDLGVTLLEFFRKIEEERVPTPIYLGFKIKETVPALIGAQLEKRTTFYRQYIQDIVKDYIRMRRLSPEKAAKIYSNIILGGSATVLGMPILYTPRVAPDSVKFKEEPASKLLKSEISFAGKTPTPQKIISFLSKVLEFTEIWAMAYRANLESIETGLIQEINAEKETTKTPPKTLSNLVESSIFSDFEKYTARIEKEFPGLFVTCSALIRCIKGMQSREGSQADTSKTLSDLNLPPDFLSESYDRALKAMVKQMQPGKKHEHDIDLIFEEILIWLNTNPLYTQEETERHFVDAQFRSTNFRPDFVKMTHGGQDALDLYYKVMLKSQGKKGEWQPRAVIASRSLYFEGREQAFSSHKVYDQKNLLDIGHPFKEKLIKALDEREEDLKKLQQKKEDMQKDPKTLKKELDKVERQIEELSTKFDELALDFHTSPRTEIPVIEGNDINEIIGILKKRGWASEKLWVRVDTTIDYLHSDLVINLLEANKKDYDNGEIHFAFTRSAHKFDGMTFDRLSGGFIEIFSKDVSILKRFNKYKKLAPAETQNIQGFGLLFDYAPKELDAFREIVFGNVKLLNILIDPKNKYQETQLQQSSDPSQPIKENFYVVLCKDPTTYFLQIQWVNDPKKHSNWTVPLIFEEIRKRCARKGFHIYNRDGFIYRDTVASKIGEKSIRIAVGGESPEKMKILADAINEVCQEKQREITSASQSQAAVISTP